MRRALVLLLFLLSGAAALAYQVAWTRHLVLVFGNTTRAVSLILAAYMLGLALGSEAGGRLADRVRRPVLWYAAFEASIGIFALLFPALVGGVRAAYLALGTAASPVLFVGAFAVLLVPTFLMGTTLPLLVRATVDAPERTGGTVGLLYGANTLGAVAGTAVTGFWLIEAAGVLGSTRWAAAVNVLVGALGLLVPLLPTRSRGAPAPSRAPAGAAPASAAGRPAAAALCAVFAGGLVGLAAEVVWTRLLVFFLQGFTYTFSALLTMFLLGLALGALAFGRVAARSPAPARTTGRLQLMVGVLSAAVLLVLVHHHAGTQAVWAWVGDTLGIEELRPRHVVTLLVASGVVLLPPAFVMGGVFPLAAAAYQRGLGDLGARIGRLYAVNTVGAVLGALVAGFVLAPLAGPSWSAVAVAAGGVATGAAVLHLAGTPRGEWLRWVGGSAVAATVLCAAAGPQVPFLLRSHVFAGSRARENRLLETREGVVCQVSVVANDRDDYRLLYTDEFQAAGTKPEYRYMRMLAHLPVALADDPSSALVICFGTGTTAGSVAVHPEVRRLDIVEISPEVLEVAPAFAAENKDVLGSPRPGLDLRVHVDDGRNFVLRSREQWGVISLEPLMPYTPAAMHLYTADFYRECRPRLAPGGTMCQWIPLQGLSAAHLRQLVSAFVEVFPGAAMFHVDGAVALIGGDRPVELDYARVAERCASPAVHADLRAVGFDDPVRALATFVAAGDVLAEFAAVEPMTDEHPTLEFHPIPLNVQLKHLWENLVELRAMRDRIGTLPLAGDVAPEVADRADVAFKVGALLLEGAERLEAAGLLGQLGRATEASQEFAGARRAYRFAAALDPADPAARRAYATLEREAATIEAKDRLRAGDLDAAERALLEAARFPTLRQRDVVPTLLAETRNRLERFEDALDAALDATRLYPRGLLPRAERAYARAALGDASGAAQDYRTALAGESLDALPPRLASDAARVLAAPGAETGPDVAGAVERALAGERVAGVPARLALRLAADEHPDAYDAHFARDLHDAAAASLPTPERMLAVKRLQLAAPTGAAEVLARLAGDAAAEPALRGAACRALGDVEPARLADLLASDAPADVLVAAAESVHGAAETGDALVALLLHADPAVRRAAQRGLLGLAAGDVPELLRLRTGDPPDDVYRERVDDVARWWRSVAPGSAR